MQAVILAGGKGTRLRPITYEIPKPMVPVSRKPFLLHQLELIKSFRIDKVLLLVGYLGDQVRDFFGDGSRFGLRIEYSFEETPLGTGGALVKAKGKLASEFVLLNGDTYLPIEYDELIGCFYRSHKVGVITAYNNFEKVLPNNLAVGTSNLVLEYNKNNPKGMTHVDAGVLVCKRDLLHCIPEGQECSLEETVYSELIRRKELLAFVVNQRFYDMGSFSELELLKDVLKQ
ncbi:MAG: NTP transferase domain-containing protein [Candidatus Scalindua sp.]|nr:NTP transferase domain-containing protein [Candidatus Scalindua sp.]